MLLGKKSEEEIPHLLARETGLIEQIDKEAYRRLGSRYLWYNKVRTAAKSGIHLFEDKSLEEQMEATRAALQMLGRNLDYGIGMAFNATLESIGKSSYEEEGLPEKLEIPDRNNPPSVKEEGDALIISFMPIRFLSLGKVVRDKGKGIDFYSEGLVKKFYFKVLAFYCDPANWHPDRLGYMIAGLDDEAPIADISAKLAPLKTELELFAASFQMFKFGRQARGPKEAGQGNALDETFEISNAELLADLYMQSFILSGMGHFLFRYFLTLIACTNNPRAYRLIANIFLPALAKSEEMRIRFQGSFTMEREKIRLRPLYQPYFKECEAKPVVETVKHKGVERRKLNYTHRLQEISAFVRAGALNHVYAGNFKFTQPVGNIAPRAEFHTHELGP